MEYKFSMIFAILIVLTALAVAGCTTTTTSPAATSAPGTATPGTAASGVTLFDMTRLNWYTYRMSTGGQDIDLKTEVSTATYGNVSDARHVRSTTTIGTSGQERITDVYFDPSNNKLLGGQEAVVMNGTVIQKMNIAAGDSRYSKSDVTRESSTIMPLSSSIETVIVPKGTYTATKYTANNNNTTMAYWMASGLPLPVQMTVSAPGSSITMQLVDYG